MLETTDHKFKSELKKIDETENHVVQLFLHYFYDPPKLNIFLTRLRSLASFFNLDLFRVGIVSGPSCRCGTALENLKHFLFWIVQYIPTSQNYIDRYSQQGYNLLTL